MKTIQLLPIEKDPSDQEFRFYPYFIIGRLLKLGVGKVEADKALCHGGKVDFVFTSHLTGKTELIGSLSEGFYRPALARFGPSCGAEDILYSGNTLFACEHKHAGCMRAHRFSMYVSNARVSGFWLRLYLYQIDGVWSLKEESH